MPESAFLPVLYSIAGSVLFGVQIILTKRSLEYLDSPQTCSMIVMGTCLLIFWSAASFFMEFHFWTNPAVLIFILTGFFHPLFSMYLGFEATKRLGPTISAIIASTTPLIATAGAVLFLEGETLTMQLLLGIMGTVVGIVLLIWKRKGFERNWTFPILLFPIGAASLRAGNQVVGKFGLSLLPSPFFACLISFTVSFFCSFLIFRHRTARSSITIPLAGFKWAVATGVCTAMGILCMYSALSSGPVVVVSPILSTFPIFTTIITLLFRQEKLTFRSIFAMIIVVSAVVWISVNR